ncbi:hypothetical protein [Litchfieldia alkalitelluris]|uniref:hypothetical protein n=1 Tax=Litchfieldia alkalitelluris TaxID=304268 RepID=UPI000997445F|nr:hypothetical protein [Litchfieldia alkalitelluris]
MSDANQTNNENVEAPERKKVSLQELMKQQLANKKQAQAKGQKHGLSTNQKAKSQMTKKPSNTRRKMGV